MITTQRIVLLVTLVLLCALPALAAPPKTINYQGILTDSAGKPVSGESKVVTFRIYDTELATVSLWREDHTVTPVKGQFSVLLGSVDPSGNPLALPFDKPYWVGVQVKGDAEMTPRRPLSSVPYAYAAATADLSATSTTTTSLSAALQTSLDARYVPAVQAPALQQLPKYNSILHPATLTGSDAQVTIGANGFPLIAYTDTTNALMLVRCFNAACSDYASKKMDSDGHSVSLALGSDGYPVMAYLSNSYKTLKHTRCEDSECKVATISTPLFTSANSLTRPSIAIGYRGYPLIAVGDFPSSGAGQLKLVECSNRDCTAKNTNVVTTASLKQASHSLVVKPGGIPIIFYYEPSPAPTPTTGYLKAAACSNLSCSAGASVYSIAETGLALLATPPPDISATIGIEGLPIVAFYSLLSTDLRVAHCNNSSCNASTVTTIDSTSAACGRYNSIAIGGDGLPVISYLDVTNNSVHVAHCSNAECTTVLIYAPINPTNDVTSTSITAGADGLPVVTYTESTGQLSILKCVSPFCTNYFSRR